MQDAAKYICPECIQGKHPNCDGVGNMEADGSFSPCYCKTQAHPNRKDILGPDGRVAHEAVREDVGIMHVDRQGTMVISQNINVNTREINYEEWHPLAGLPDNTFSQEDDGTPPNEPGETAMTLEDGHITGDGIRMRPDAQIVKDFLMDAEVQNDRGEWVPAIPTPIFLWFGRVQCHCGEKRWGRVRYMEHYAYAHILGMRDL